MATYGEGDPTDNAMEFYEWLQNGDADLTGLNYAVSCFSLSGITFAFLDARCNSGISIINSETRKTNCVRK